MKRSDSGHKLVLENYEKGSIKSLEINYSSNISKKIKNFCEVVSVKEVQLWNLYVIQLSLNNNLYAFFFF